MNFEKKRSRRPQFFRKKVQPSHSFGRSTSKTFSFCMFLSAKVQHSHTFGRSTSKNLQFLYVFQCQNTTLTQIWQVNLQKPSVFVGFFMPKCNTYTKLACRPPKTFSFCMFFDAKVQHSHKIGMSTSKNLQFLYVF